MLIHMTAPAPSPKTYHNEIAVVTMQVGINSIHLSSYIFYGMRQFCACVKFVPLTGVIRSDVPRIYCLAIQWFDMGHNAYGLNMYGVVMIRMGNERAGGHCNL